MSRFQFFNASKSMAGTLAAILVFIIAGCSKNPERISATKEELFKNLDSKNLKTRRDAIFSISSMISEGGLSKVDCDLQRLQLALQDDDYMVRIFAAHSLADLGECVEETRVVYQLSMKDSNVWSRVQSCCGVSKNPKLLNSSLDILRTGLADKDSSVNAEAVISLSKVDKIEDVKTIDLLILIIIKSKSMVFLQIDTIKLLLKVTSENADYTSDGISDIVVSDEASATYKEVLAFLKNISPKRK